MACFFSIYLLLNFSSYLPASNGCFKLLFLIMFFSNKVLQNLMKKLKFIMTDFCQSLNSPTPIISILKKIYDWIYNFFLINTIFPSYKKINNSFLVLDVIHHSKSFYVHTSENNNFEKG